MVLRAASLVLLVHSALASATSAQLDADFTAAPLAGPAPLTVQFTDQSTGNIATRLWLFGDGTFSTQKNPLHTYTGEGSYTVTLQVATGGFPGNTDIETKPDFIDVGPVEGAPQLGFLAEPASGVSALEVDFSNTSTETDFVIAWHWDFGDGAAASTEDATHTFTAPGTYDVSLTATVDYNGNVFDVSLIQLDAVEVLPPLGGLDVKFSVSPNLGVVPLDVTFTNTSTDTEFVESWHWDFGDGTTADTEDAAHTFIEPGPFTVTLTALGGGGQVSETRTVFAQPALSFEASGPLTAPASLTVQFVNTSPSAEAVDSWTWSFGDGASASGLHATHTYTEPGVFSVSLEGEANGLAATVSIAGLIEVGGPLGPPIRLQGPTDHTRLLLADLDGDGAEELITWSWQAEGLAVWQALGGGAFAPPDVLNVPGLADVVAGNVLGGPGRELLAATRQPDTLLTLSWEDRQLSVVQQSALPPHPFGSSWDLATLQADGDGLLDVVVSSWPEYGVLLGHGDGGFEARGPFLTMPVFYSDIVRTGDVDGDGFDDIVLSEMGDGDLDTALIVWIAQGDGSGTFDPVLDVFSNTCGVAFPGPPSGYGAIDLADLTGDGRLDYLVQWVGSLWTVEPGYQFSLCGNPEGPLPSPHLGVGDLNGDGSPDVVAVGSANHPATVFLSDGPWGGDSGGSAEVTSLGGLGFVTGDAAAGDVDGDGDADAVYLEEIGGRLVVRQSGFGLPGVDVVSPGLAGSSGVPLLGASGALEPASLVTIALERAAPGAPTWLATGLAPTFQPFSGGTLVPDVELILFTGPTDASGGWSLATRWPAALGPGTTLWCQAWIVDPVAPAGLAASNGLALSP